MATILVGGALLAVVILVITKLHRDRKQGGGCGGGCSGCPASSLCHPEEEG